MNLHLSHIRKTYGARTVLADCSFAFERGGAYALMGPNGSGKSTFFRICALLERPDAGTLAFSDDERELPHDLALRRRITLVLPRTGLFNDTVFRNAAYGLAVRGIPRKEIGERVARTLAFVGLEQKARQHALTLSSGEAQRLGIARALAIAPEVLFLDEPTASVDEENTRIIERIIGELKQEGRTTVVLTTHDREQAERLADKVLSLSHGILAG